MNLLSDILKQNQQIAQNPTPVARTPIQTAYDTLLNAQKNAQDTTKQELGSAIGNSVNGIAKIIASSVIGNPIEKAASTRNLDNFDARQDALVRQWAMEQAKKRNDFVNQAKEQLDMAKADEQQQYERDLTSQQLAYKKLQDEIANKLNEDKFDFMKEQAGIENQNKADMLELQKRKLNAEIESLQNKPEKTEEDVIKLNKLQIELQKAEEDLKKAQYENSDEYKQEQKTQEQNKQIISMAKDLFDKKQITGEQFNQIVNNPQSFKNLENRNWGARIWRKLPLTDTNALKFTESKNTNNDPLGVL